MAAEDEAIWEYLDVDEDALSAFGRPTQIETRYGRGGTSDPIKITGESDEAYQRRLSEWREASAAFGQRQARERAGLGGDRLFDYASRLARVASGEEKTPGQIEAERSLRAMAGAQTGRARAQTGFDVGETLRAGTRAAQSVERVGGAKIAAKAKEVQQATREQLEQLLIAGEQRAADEAFGRERMALQREQAEGAMWGNVLSGILGATGAVVGAVFAGGPAGAAAGGSAGAGLGQAIGEWVA